MDPSHIPAAISGLAGSAVAAFVAAVVLDDVLGVIDAASKRKFDWRKLPSFVESQFGTKKAMALASALVVVAVSHGDVRSAAEAAVTAGGSAMTLAVLRDCWDKIQSIAGINVAPPKPADGIAPFP